MRQLIYQVIAVSAIIAFGHSQASAQVINGCVSKNGTLKIVADLSDCSLRETPISWNQAGPQGESGETGPQGELGAYHGTRRIIPVTPCPSPYEAHRLTKDALIYVMAFRPVNT